MALAAALGVASQFGGQYLNYRLARSAGSVIPGAGALPAIARGAAPAVRSAARIAGRYGGRVAGAVATGAIIYDAFGNPVGRKRKRRARGLSAHELRAFKRVTRFLSGYCPTVRRFKSVAKRKCR